MKRVGLPPCRAACAAALGTRKAKKRRRAKESGGNRVGVGWAAWHPIPAFLPEEPDGLCFLPLTHTATDCMLSDSAHAVPTPPPPSSGPMRRRLAPVLLLAAALLLAARPWPAVIAAGKHPPMPLEPPGYPSLLPFPRLYIIRQVVPSASASVTRFSPVIAGFRSLIRWVAAATVLAAGIGSALDSTLPSTSASILFCSLLPCLGGDSLSR
jgi:hypothetical protein